MFVVVLSFILFFQKRILKQKKQECLRVIFLEWSGFGRHLGNCRKHSCVLKSRSPFKWDSRNFTVTSLEIPVLVKNITFVILNILPWGTIQTWPPLLSLKNTSSYFAHQGKNLPEKRTKGEIFHEVSYLCS